MTLCFAQPYDSSVSGFYFSTIEDYQAKVARNRNSEGDKVEEYELQFIDGEALDGELFLALSVHQGTIHAFLAACEDWEEGDKINVILCVGECGYCFDLEKDSPDQFDLDLYEFDTLSELAEYFVEEGLFGEIPDHLRYYIDYDAIARDLSADYCETLIAGRRLIYRCA
ncbi:MAG: antirestriction protein ArdA [Methyloligellaceae bacterium]